MKSNSNYYPIELIRSPSEPVYAFATFATESTLGIYMHTVCIHILEAITVHNTTYKYTSHTCSIYADTGSEEDNGYRHKNLGCSEYVHLFFTLVCTENPSSSFAIRHYSIAASPVQN